MKTLLKLLKMVVALLGASCALIVLLAGALWWLCQCDDNSHEDDETCFWENL